MHDCNLPQTPDTQQVGPLGLRRRHRLSAWRSGSTPGSDGMRHMVLRTPLQPIWTVTGKPITAWRNQAFHHDGHTCQLLGELGIRIAAPPTRRRSNGSARNFSLFRSIRCLTRTMCCMNIMSPNARISRSRRKGRFRNGETVERQGEIDDEQLGGVIILVRPLCMDVANGTQLFEQLCRISSRYKTPMGVGGTSKPLSIY